jgi:hypothetical protein
MVESKFRFFVGKVCKIWLTDGFFRQGKVVESNDTGIILDDRKDGIIFLNDDLIAQIKEVKNGC